MVQRRKTLANDYKPYLYLLIAFVDEAGPDYPRTREFTEAELLKLTPDHIEIWTKQMAYGTSIPGPTNLPTFCPRSTLEHAKKASSFYMPNKHMSWDARSKAGNPSKSIVVNDIVHSVDNAEVPK
jgi:hypothetical protein